jgi:hypothetical protein
LHVFFDLFLGTLTVCGHNLRSMAAPPKVHFAGWDQLSNLSSCCGSLQRSFSEAAAATPTASDNVSQAGELLPPTETIEDEIAMLSDVCAEMSQRLEALCDRIVTRKLAGGV